MTLTRVGRALARGLLAVLSSAVALLLAEGAVRLAGAWPEQRAALAREAEATMLAVEAADEGEEEAREQGASHFVMHPLVGWSLRPSIHWPDRPDVRPPTTGVAEWLYANRDVNVIGFHSAVRDYRRVAADDFVVALFGGSVAQNVAMRGGAALVRRIERRRPELAGKVVVLNLAIGGYKQPQQLILLHELMLLGANFDIAVNLDGFNEAAIGAEDAADGFHPLLPSRRSLGAVFDASTRSPTIAEIELIAEVRRTAREELALRRAMERAWYRHSWFARAWAGQRLLDLEARRLAAEEELRSNAPERLSSIYNLTDPCLGRPGACFQLIGDLWQRASYAMAHQAASLGLLYVHALQPNQYYGGKPLSRDERACCYKPEVPLFQWAAEGYPELAARGPKLRAIGVDYHDLTGLFDVHRETLYEDSCCHLNDRGNELLADRLGELVADALDRRDGRTAN